MSEVDVWEDSNFDIVVASVQNPVKRDNGVSFERHEYCFFNINTLHRGENFRKRGQRELSEKTIALRENPILKFAGAKRVDAVAYIHLFIQLFQANSAIAWRMEGG